MNPMDFSLLTVLVAAANIAYFWRRAVVASRETPEKAEGYFAVFRAVAMYLGFGAVFLVIGQRLGLAEPVGQIRPDSVMTPPVHWTTYEIVFHLVNVALFVWFSVWLFLRNGAEFLVEHRAVFPSFPQSVGGLKMLWGLLLLVSAVSAAIRYYPG